VWLILSSLIATATPFTPTTLTAHLADIRTERLAQSPPTPTTAEVRRAFAGEIVAGVEIVQNIKAGKGYAIAVLNIAAKDIWRGITDEDHHAGPLMIDVSKTVDGIPRRDHHTLFQYLAIPFFSDRWWLVLQDFNEALFRTSGGKVWEVAWTDRLQDQAFIDTLEPALIDDGIPILWANGAWLLVDLGDGRTFMEYHTWSHPGGRAPVGPMTLFAARSVKSNLEAMVAFSKGHAKTCPASFVKPDGTPL
jgi:hypothetical protein